jgi:feruloyl esterase
MEVWLPQNWTGRFLSTGNGGLGGCIQYEDLDYATSLGFASVGTNNGRQGFKAVQTFPNDFNGVVAGAPAFSFNNLTS